MVTFGDWGTAEAYSDTDITKVHSPGVFPWKPARVGWSSLNNQTPEEAEAFANRVLAAVAAAREMDTRHGLDT
jgi:hypothetical protein